jgi:hypothetical protein
MAKAIKKESRGKARGILFGIGRYVFGLLIIVLTAGLIILKTGNIGNILIMLVAFPFAFIVDPVLLIGLYFMLTGKTRIRIDVTLLLIVIVCLGLLATAKF